MIKRGGRVVEDAMEQTVMKPAASNFAPLEEYKEALAHWRHNDQMAWTILGLTSTVAVGLWAYTFKDAPFWSAKSVGLAGLGVLALVTGRLMARRLTAYTHSLIRRVNQLERVLGFELMCEFDSRMPGSRSIGINFTLDAVAVTAVAAWVVYLIAYLVAK